LLESTCLFNTILASNNLIKSRNSSEFIFINQNRTSLIRRSSTVATPILLKPLKAHALTKKSHINKCKNIDIAFQKKPSREPSKDQIDLKIMIHCLQEIIICIFGKAMPHISKVCDDIISKFNVIQKTRGDSYAMDLIKKLRNWLKNLIASEGVSSVKLNVRMSRGIPRLFNGFFHAIKIKDVKHLRLLFTVLEYSKFIKF